MSNNADSWMVVFGDGTTFVGQSVIDLLSQMGIEATYVGRNDYKDPPKLQKYRARNRSKRCHELAIKILVGKEPKGTPWRLVQGYYSITVDAKAHHSWLECGETVYDAVQDDYFSRDEYRREFGAVGIHEFSQQEATIGSIMNPGECILKACGPDVIWRATVFEPAKP
jgi:hypothetical protein